MPMRWLPVAWVTAPMARGAANAVIFPEKEKKQMLDELVSRACGREQDRPTFAYFELQLSHMFPTLRNDRAFIQLVIDMLKLERPAYRSLHAYAIADGWPTWT